MACCVIKKQVILVGHLRAFIQQRRQQQRRHQQRRH